MPKHIPVLLKEVIDLFNPQVGNNVIDCTFGGGGHSQAILKKISPQGKVLGIEADVSLFKTSKIINKNIILINDNFVNLKKIYERSFPYPVNFILFDLGLSSMELDSSGRGFSFRFDEPLDMRFNPDGQRLTAAEALNKYGRHKLADIFIKYGEINKFKAKRVADEIIKSRGSRQFKNTSDLVKVVFRALHPKLMQGEKIDLNDKKFFKGHTGRKRIHPATLFFQALRIEVNNELENFASALRQAIEILEPGGRIAVISFHSLEDRIAKNYFRELYKSGQVGLLTKKPVVPSEDEIKKNPRSRSAKLRVIEKIK